MEAKDTAAELNP